MNNVAERIAMNICWLARQTALTEETRPRPLPKAGLPDVPAIRQAVAQRHPATCDWCDYPLEELLRMGKVEIDSEGVEESAARAFRRLPVHQQRELVTEAQGAR